SNRVRGRTRAATNGEWSCRQQELPSVPSRRRIPERLQIAVVEEVYAEVHKREVVNGATQVRWRNVLRMITTENGNVALLEPGDDGGFRPGGLPAFGAAAQPWPGCLPASPHAGAHEQRIAGRHFHAGPSFPCLQILDIDRRARLEIRDALESRNVEQDAARENPILEIVDGIF